MLLEMVEVSIGSPENWLDNIVQPGEQYRTRNLNAPPDRSCMPTSVIFGWYVGAFDFAASISYMIGHPGRP